MRRRLLRNLAPALAVLVVAVYGAWRVYVVPRGALLEEERRLRAEIDWYEGELGALREVRGRLGAIARTTLGAASDEIEHTFRARLGEIAREAGLVGVVVSSGAPEPLANPASQGRGRVRGRLGELLRDRPDAWVVRGSIGGEGTLEGVARTTALVEAQEWVHRLESFSIKPVGKDRERFSLRLEVATLVAPDLIPADFEPPPIVTLSELGEDRRRRLAFRNVFAPPPPAAEAEAVVTESEPPPAFHEWKVTGVARGVNGSEALVVNTRTGERRRLLPGDSLLGATLVGISVDRVTFEREKERFSVRLGGTLQEREPA